MSEVADGDGVLLFDIGIERPLVVDLEIEDSVLIGELEACCILTPASWSLDILERKTVEWREHGELKLNRITRQRNKWSVSIPEIFSDLNVVSL